MRAVGYFRVSDEDQVEGWSLDAQRRAFEEFCISKGWTVMGHYSEEGRSAWGESVSSRPTFRAMLEDAAQHKFDVVVTHTLDRFSRNLRVLLDSFHTLSQHNVTYVSIQQQIDYSTPEGRLFMMMLGAFAQYFSDALSGHTKKGMKERAQQGLFNGEPPFGYERCTSECFGLEGHPGCHVIWEKALLVKELFSRYVSGNASLYTLAQWMNEQGARTNYRRGIMLYDGTTLNAPRSFTQASIRWILHNSFYTGKVKYGDELYQGVHQPLIDQELFDEVQRRLVMARSRNHTKTSAKRNYPLMGLARCATCGQPMWAETAGRSKVAYYREPLMRSAGNCTHAGKSIRSEPVDAQLDSVFSSFRLKQDWKEWITERLSTQRQRDEATQRKSSLEARHARLRNLYLDGDITREFYDRSKREIQDQIEELTIPEINASVIAGELLENMEEVWIASDAGQRNRLLTSMLNAVFIDQGKRSIVGLLPRPAFREPLLCLEENGQFRIYDPKAEAAHEGVNGVPAKDSLGRYGGDGGGSNSPSRRLPDQNVLQAYPVISSRLCSSLPARALARPAD